MFKNNKILIIVVFCIFVYVTSKKNTIKLNCTFICKIKQLFVYNFLHLRQFANKITAEGAIDS